MYFKRKMTLLETNSFLLLKNSSFSRSLVPLKNYIYNMVNIPSGPTTPLEKFKN